MSLEYIVFIVAVVTGFLLEILYVSLNFFVCSRRITKNGSYRITEDERTFQGSRSHFLWRSGERLSTYNFPFVDYVSDLCITVQEILEFVVGVLSPNKKFLSSVFIYGKPVRNNGEILFLSESYCVPLMCESPW